MFDKELFLSPCEKYDVKLHASLTSLSIKEGKQTHAITERDVRRVLHVEEKENE